MLNTLLSLLLSMQLFLCSAAPLPADPAAGGQALSLSAGSPARATRLWWGMIDPELAAWFARLPLEQEEEEKTILWDWSWRGFLAAIFPTFQAEEGCTDAGAV